MARPPRRRVPAPAARRRAARARARAAAGAAAAAAAPPRPGPRRRGQGCRRPAPRDPRPTAASGEPARPHAPRPADGGAARGAHPGPRAAGSAQHRGNSARRAAPGESAPRLGGAGLAGRGRGRGGGGKRASGTAWGAGRRVQRAAGGGAAMGPCSGAARADDPAAPRHVCAAPPLWGGSLGATTPAARRRKQQRPAVRERAVAVAAAVGCAAGQRACRVRWCPRRAHVCRLGPEPGPALERAARTPCARTVRGVPPLEPRRHSASPAARRQSGSGGPCWAPAAQGFRRGLALGTRGRTGRTRRKQGGCRPGTHPRRRCTARALSGARPPPPRRAAGPVFAGQSSARARRAAPRAGERRCKAPIIRRRDPLPGREGPLGGLRAAAPRTRCVPRAGLLPHFRTALAAAPAIPQLSIDSSAVPPPAPDRPLRMLHSLPARQLQSQRLRVGARGTLRAVRALQRGQRPRGREIAPSDGCAARHAAGPRPHGQARQDRHRPVRHVGRCAGAGAVATTRRGAARRAAARRAAVRAAADWRRRLGFGRRPRRPLSATRRGRRPPRARHRRRRRPGRGRAGRRRLRGSPARAGAPAAVLTPPPPRPRPRRQGCRRQARRPHHREARRPGCAGDPRAAGAPRAAVPPAAPPPGPAQPPVPRSGLASRTPPPPLP
jgi:hypothetical protein